MLELYYERKNAKEKENKEKIKKAQKNWGFGEYKKEDEKIFISKISNFFAVIIFNSVKIIIKTNIKENQSSCFKSNLNKKHKKWKKMKKKQNSYQLLNLKEWKKKQI